MSLESLVEEIRQHAEAELHATMEQEKAEGVRILADRDRRVAEIRAASQRATEMEMARERAQRVAAAKLQHGRCSTRRGSKRLEQGLQETRALLADYTASADYPAVLEAHGRGRRTPRSAAQLRISGRARMPRSSRRSRGGRSTRLPSPILGGSDRRDDR